MKNVFNFILFIMLSIVVLPAILIMTLFQEKWAALLDELFGL